MVNNLVDNKEVELIREMEAAIASEESLETTQAPGFRADVSEIPGAQGMVVAAQDAASWIAAWQLSAGQDGKEYGSPVKLPKGQLAHYLAKRRPDGGKRFTLNIPPLLAPPPRFQCFIDECTKRVDQRVKLIGHIETYHPYKAQMYATELTRLKDAVVKDNPRLKAMIDEMIAEGDPSYVEVPKEVLAAQEPEPDYSEAVEFSPKVEPKQPDLYWCPVEGCGRFFDTAQGRQVHVGNGHKHDG